LGIIASEQNELDRARALFEEALVLVRALGRQREITHLLGDLGLVAHRHGDNEAAVKYLEEALTGHDSVDEWTMTVMRGNLGLAYWGLGDQARAAALFEDALVASRRLGDRYGEAINQFNLANYALRRNRLSEAATRYRESIAGANELGGVRLVNRALDGLAAVVAARRVPELAAQLFGAATALREATGDVLDATEEAERAPIVATIREQLGEQAWAKASSAGETLTLEAAIAEADAVMEPLRGAGERGAQMADALLTTREAEVLRLLVEGRSDREIADALFITRATASKHVSNILAKLEVDSRAAAAAQAVRDRLI
ncbi:MAG TPA: tetratricopeptide repeat protein, partial [Mycobacterium sp.]|nr:tetratricopeptide repeat protein [Mycobacterium sp.]